MGTAWSSRAEPAIAGTIGVSQPMAAGLHLAPTTLETLQLPASTQTVTVVSTATETKTVTLTEFNQETMIPASEDVPVPDVGACRGITISTALFLVVGAAVFGALMVYDPRFVVAGRDQIKKMASNLPRVKSTEAATKRSEEDLVLAGTVASASAEAAPANADLLAERDDPALLVIESEKVSEVIESEKVAEENV